MLVKAPEETLEKGQPNAICHRAWRSHSIVYDWNIKSFNKNNGFWYLSSRVSLRIRAIYGQNICYSQSRERQNN